LGEDADPHLAVALHVTSDRNARGFDLVGIEPAAFQRHQAVLAEGDRVAAHGQASAVPAVHLAVLYSIGHQGHTS